MSELDNKKKKKKEKRKVVSKIIRILIVNEKSIMIIMSLMTNKI